MKKHNGLFGLYIVLLGMWFVLPARAASLLDTQPGDGLSSSYSFRSPDGLTLYEATDDIDVIGNVNEVVVTGYQPNFPYSNFGGLYVRFYANASGAPGALQAEYFLAAGDANLSYEPQFASWFDIKLPAAFAASGRHFLAVQIVAAAWSWNSAAFQRAPMYTRTGGSAWQPQNRGLAFAVYGTVTGPGRIDNISPASATRSGFLVIQGANFDADGQVLIDGLPAPVASWLPGKIVTYVPEGARLGSVPVQVVTAPGGSNAASIDVTDRQPNGRALWRFRMDAPYSIVRPALGLDGTVYVIDVYSRLYALTPNGALKWIARVAGNKGLAVGPDGTVYTASENDVRAFFSDGVPQWTFIQNPRAFILLGLAVGPDGNLYAVGTQGMGVFSLRPDGTERWRTTELYNRLIVNYGEIVMGPNGANQQLYFYANNHTRAVQLDNGASVFTIPPTGQPVVSPFDRTMHAKASAYSPGGQLLWTFNFPISGLPVSDPDVGSDGTHYVVNRTLDLWAIGPSGSAKWNFTLPSYVGVPTVDPANSLVVLPSGNTLDHPGFIQGFSIGARKIAWQVDLPPEETSVYNPWIGQFGFNQYVDTRPRFSPDSQTAYLVTAIAPGGLVADRCFLYAISAGGSTPPPPPPSATKLRSTNITLSAKQRNGTVTVNGDVTVADENGSAVGGAAVQVRWTLPSGSTSTATATTNTQGIARFSVRGSRGTYTLTVTGISKAGYTFDPAASVLSRSITQ